MKWNGSSSDGEMIVAAMVSVEPTFWRFVQLDVLIGHGLWKKPILFSVRLDHSFSGLALFHGLGPLLGKS
jgi:hypothetical protein